jgi:hypothetical protein
LATELDQTRQRVQVLAEELRKQQELLTVLRDDQDAAKVPWLPTAAKMGIESIRVALG